MDGALSKDSRADYRFRGNDCATSRDRLKTIGIRSQAPKKPEKGPHGYRFSAHIHCNLLKISEK
jgi:hypothetical protein